MFLTNCLITWHLSIRLDSMFQAIKFPTGIAHLATGLANMDGDALTLKWKKEWLKNCSFWVLFQLYLKKT